MQELKNPEDFIKEYLKVFGESPPEIPRVDMEERLDEIIDAIDSGIPMPPAEPLDPNIDY